MGVDVADAAPEQRFAIDEVEHFPVRGAGRLRQPSQGAQNVITLPQIAECEFAHNERMPEHLSAAE